MDLKIDESFLKFISHMDTHRGALHYQWVITEDIQDDHPYVTWGWDGFVPFIHYGV